MVDIKSSEEIRAFRTFDPKLSESIKALWEKGLNSNEIYSELVKQGNNPGHVVEAIKAFVVQSSSPTPNPSSESVPHKSGIKWMKIAGWIGIVFLFFLIILVVFPIIGFAKFSWYQIFSLIMVGSVIILTFFFIFGFKKMGDHTETRLLSISSLIILIFYGLAVGFIIYAVATGNNVQNTLPGVQVFSEAGRAGITGGVITGQEPECSATNEGAEVCRDDSRELCTCTNVDSNYIWMCGQRIGSCDYEGVYVPPAADTIIADTDTPTNSNPIDLLGADNLGAAPSLGWQFYLLLISVLIDFVLLICFSVGLIKVGDKVKYAKISGILNLIVFGVLIVLGIYFLIRILIDPTYTLILMLSIVGLAFQYPRLSFGINILFYVFTLFMLLLESLALFDASRKFEN